MYASDEELITVIDTGVDTGHCFFRSPDAPRVHHRLGEGKGLGKELRRLREAHDQKVVAVVSVSWPPFFNVSGDLEDYPNGHGTHVVGTAAGDPCPEGEGAQGGQGGRGASEASRQPGKGARVLVFDVHAGDEEGELEVPPLIGPLLEAAYEAGSRVFTNSWGEDVNYYSTYAWELDQFMWRHPDAVVLVANGNWGDEGWGTVGSPATARNVFAVGASVSPNDRWRTQEDWQYPGRKSLLRRETILKNPARYEATHLASFSSRGPAFDGRRKPFFVVPGMYLLSARAKGRSPRDLLLMEGTSMATPLAARAVAITR